jgi:hypothetical protein
MMDGVYGQPILNPGVYGMRLSSQQQPAPPMSNSAASKPEAVYYQGYGWVVPVATGMANAVADQALNQTYARKAKPWLERVVSSSVGDQVLHHAGLQQQMANASRQISQVAANHLPIDQFHRVATRIAETPTVGETLGLGQDVVPLKQAVEKPGRFFGTVQRNFRGLAQGSQYTDDVSFALYALNNPASFGKSILSASFLKPIAEMFAKGQGFVTGGLYSLAVVGVFLDSVLAAKTARENAERQDDGSFGARLRTEGATVGTFTSRLMKNGASWLAGSLGFALGKAALCVALGGSWPAVLAGVCIGAFFSAATGWALNKAFPDGGNAPS